MDTERVPVIQSDREAAWPFRADCYGHGDKFGWMSGKYDHVRIIQAFAKERVRIVAWLRSDPIEFNSSDYPDWAISEMVASRIERGEHSPTPAT